PTTMARNRRCYIPVPLAPRFAGPGRAHRPGWDRTAPGRAVGQTLRGSDARPREGTRATGPASGRGSLWGETCVPGWPAPPWEVRAEDMSADRPTFVRRLARRSLRRPGAGGG